jgi:hypothetical protein
VTHTTSATNFSVRLTRSVRRASGLVLVVNAEVNLGSGLRVSGLKWAFLMEKQFLSRFA